ncbi:MAG: OmpH family outer membrane protein [Candidatus Puniceispirillales bacterium]
MTRRKSSSSASVAGSRLLNRIGSRLSAALVALILAVSAPVAWAQDETLVPNFSFGIVDMNAVMQQSNAIKVIRQALDEQNALFQEQISEEELALRNEEKKLNEDKPSISKEEFNTRLADFESRVIRLQRSIQAQKSSFDNSFNQAQEKLQQELVKVISDIASERGYAMVIQKQNAVIFDTNLDITPLALERLNERTKNLKVTLEKKE